MRIDQRLWRDWNGPAGRLEITGKPRRADWFDGREARVEAVSEDGSPTRMILLSVSGPAGAYRLPLSAGEAASLMLEIGYAIEQASEAGRLHCDA